MPIKTEKQTDEAQIRQLIDDWSKAANNKDIEALMSCYAPDIVSFDVIPPLQYVGKDEYKKNWQQGFEMCHEPGEFETRDMSLKVGTDVAFCRRLNRMSGTMDNGEKFDFWVRWTVCFEKINNNWLITHEHISMPMEMGSDTVKKFSNPDPFYEE